MVAGYFSGVLALHNFDQEVYVRDEHVSVPEGQWFFGSETDYEQMTGWTGVRQILPIGLAARGGWSLALLMSLPVAYGQPGDSFEGREPPFWFQHATLQARGFNMGEVMCYLSFVIGSRPDVPYFLWSLNLFGEFEAILHDYESHPLVPGVVSEEVQTWCRYVDQCAHHEFMNIIHPTSKLSWTTSPGMWMTLRWTWKRTWVRANLREDSGRPSASDADFQC